MTREEALAMLVSHNSQRRMFLGETETSEALDLAIAALRESAEPAELTKEQWGLFCDIFHQEHDAWSWSEPAHRDIPAATFEAVVRMVERYMALREQPAPPAIDDLPIEDVAIIEMWLESLRMSPSVRSITIRLSDGETLYTVKNERP